VHISAAYAENRGAYGWPRIWRQLQAQVIHVAKQRVQRLMQKHGIRARGSQHASYEFNKPLKELEQNWTGAMTEIAA
jgi:transposase InsO family protein